MTTSNPLTRGDDVVLRLAASAYPARFTGTSRVHTEYERIYFAWCATHKQHGRHPTRAELAAPHDTTAAAVRHAAVSTG